MAGSTGRWWAAFSVRPHRLRIYEEEYTLAQLDAAAAALAEAAGLQLPQHLCQVLVNVLHPAQNRRLSQWSANRLNSGDGSSVLLG